MENKEFATTKKITTELICGWLVWGLLFGLLYSFLYGAITSSMESLVLKAIIAIVLQGITAFIVWKLSTQSTFKKKTMSASDVPTVMRNLIIFTVIICVITGIYNYFQVQSSIDNTIKSNPYLIYRDEQIFYNNQKVQLISEVNSTVNTYFVILEIGLTAVYLAVLPLEKREILKYVS